MIIQNFIIYILGGIYINIYDSANITFIIFR
jgi:hypothetical protein